MGVTYIQFKESLALASSLKKIERDKYPANPKSDKQPPVMGLRGGAAVLMVAAFEFFLKGLFEEEISTLNTIPVSIDFHKLPDEMKVKTVFHSLNQAMDGPRYEVKPPKVDRIGEIVAACKLLIGEQVNPKAFSETGSNPNGDTVKKKFKEVGLPNIFDKINTAFIVKWGKPVAHDFIKSKLDEIVRTRHVVAHTADALNITRTNQNEAFKFLKILAELLEKELAKHIKVVKKNAKKS